MFTKNVLSANPFNEVREGETTLVVEIIWRDLRTGEVLTRPSRRPGAPREPEERQPILAFPEGTLPGSRNIAIATSFRAVPAGLV